MNNKKQQNIQSEKTLTEIFKYNAGGEASEYHIIIHSTKPEDTYEEQLNAVLNTYDYLLTQELKGAVAILKRYFAPAVYGGSHAQRIGFRRSHLGKAGDDRGG